MGRVNDDTWLDEALDKAIHSDDTRPDFQKWIASHPEAVNMLTSRTPQMQQPHRIETSGKNFKEGILGSRRNTNFISSTSRRFAARRDRGMPCEFLPNPNGGIWRNNMPSLKFFPEVLGRIIMNATFVKLAAAAVIAIAAIVGIAQFTRDTTDQTPVIGPVAQETLTGPMTHTFADGSTVQLAAGAGIRTFADTGKRGFEHLGGQIDVAVAKGKGEFIVTSPYGDVKALGTQFTMNMVDEVAFNTKERVQLLAVKVTEGSVEVRNDKGITTLMENQDIVVAVNAAPYDFNKDETLPKELRMRIQSMVEALKARDGAAYFGNYNLAYLYKLAKGQVQYDPQLFGGCAEDSQNFQKGLGDKVSSPEELGKIVASSLHSDGGDIYITSITMNHAGEHATARCVSKSGARTVVTTPQWHYFDNAWWQIDD